jgi:hypothetical protein
MTGRVSYALEGRWISTDRSRPEGKQTTRNWTASKPSRPADPPSDYPEQPIEGSEARARMSTLRRDELLTQSEIVKKETSPLTKEADQHSEAEPDEAKHGQDL